MQKVPFITVEDEDPDMIVSFALGPNAEEGLTLLRTPKYESILDESERGVTVGTGSSEGLTRELLLSLYWLPGQAVVTSSRHEYRLDLSAVNPEEIRDAKKLLKRMNFDKRFSIRAA